MHRTLLSAALIAAIAFSGAAQAASFTYHGNLQDAGKPADGSYDLELTLYSSPEGGKVVAGPLIMYKVPVHEGTFSTEADFGQLTDVSGQSWLSVAVRNAGKGDFAALSARAPISAAETATNSSCPGSWSLNGNAGNPSGAYLGTADAHDLTLKSGGTAVMVAPQAAQGAVALSGSLAYSIFATAGKYSTAVSYANAATGPYSFAGGSSAGTLFDGSFVWGDDPSPAHQITDTGPNQFIVQAGGGVVINKGAPVDHGTELSIYPNATDGDYSNLYLGSREKGGIQLSMNPPSTATSNDAALTVDQYDGTNRARKLVVNADGLTINGTNTVDVTYHPALSVIAAPNSANNSVTVDLIPGNGANGVWNLYANASANASQEFGIGFSTSPTLGFNLLTAINDANGLRLSVDADLYVYGNAYKSFAGGWLQASDRRIKNEIVPVSDAIDTVLKLRPVSFHYTPEYRAMENNLPDKPYLGFIAQEFSQVFPEAVVSTQNHVPGAAESAPKILALDTNPALITTVAAVQELAIQAQDRDSEVAKLHAENAELRGKLDSTQSKLDGVIARLSKLESKQGE